MNTPIIEQIAVALKAEIEAVSTVNEVIRPVITGVSHRPSDHQVVLLAGERVRSEEASVMGNPPVVGWRQTFTADLFIRVSEDDTTPADTLANQFESEVVAGIMADFTHGGLAINTTLQGTEFTSPSDEYEGVTLLFEVLYRVLETDPSVRV